jgi:hypothetical protein
MARLFGSLLVLALLLSTPVSARAQEGNEGTLMEHLLERIGRVGFGETNVESSLSGTYIEVSNLTDENVAVVKALSANTYAFPEGEVTVREVLEGIGAKAGANVYAEGELHRMSGMKKFSMKAATDLSFQGALEALGKVVGADLGFTIMFGAAKVNTARELEKIRTHRRESMEKMFREIGGEGTRFLGDDHVLLLSEEMVDAFLAPLRRLKMTLREDMPLPEGMEFFKDISRVPVVISPDAEAIIANHKISRGAEAVTFEEGLNILVDSAGGKLEWVVRLPKLIIRTVEEGKGDEVKPSFILIGFRGVLPYPPESLVKPEK